MRGEDLPQDAFEKSAQDHVPRHVRGAAAVTGRDQGVLQIAGEPKDRGAL